MASVASQLIEEITTHVQSDSLEDGREICADGTYFPNNQRMSCPNYKSYYQQFHLKYLCNLASY